MAQELNFQTELGTQLPSITSDEFNLLINSLSTEYGIGLTKTTEATAYSMAMVIRYALGSFAADGNVSALIGSKFTGAIAAATLRHLHNGGANCQASLLVDEEDLSIETVSEVDTLIKLGIPVVRQSPDPSAIHTVICGTYSEKQDHSEIPNQLCQKLNESQITTHAIIAPPGIDITNGNRSKESIFAAATLSLGLPLTATKVSADYVGRHYLNDISMPQTLYKGFGLADSALFSEQPVIRIYPIEEK